tara:strand:- start:785 stop:1792 length:1008 start_codon:yes stop_codon:yes gene_type:complete
MKRKIVLYGGYSDNEYNAETVYDTKGCGGSEIALIKLAENLAKDKRNEVVVSSSMIIEGTFKGILHLNKKSLNNYLNNNEVDIAIVSRYIHYVLDHKLAKKNYLWLHDYQPHSWWNGKQFNPEVLGNLFPLFDKVVCVSDWQAGVQISRYGEHVKEFLTTIHNGVDQSNFPKEIDTSLKQSGKIVFNCRTSGLQNAVDWFNEYKKHNQNAELHVFAQEAGLQHVAGDLTGVFDRGRVSNIEMINELVTAEIWINSSTVPETFCISSVEAQLCKCIPVIMPQAGMLEITPHYNDVKSHNIDFTTRQIEENYKSALDFTWERNAKEFNVLINKKYNV